MTLLVVGLVARAVMWAALGVIVMDAVLTLWREGREVLAVAAGIFFPITILIWRGVMRPSGYPLWWAFVVAIVAYPISTFVGGLPPNRPPWRHLGESLMHTLEELGYEEGVEVEGCWVERRGQGFFLIESSGVLRGTFTTFFLPEGSHASVWITLKKGRLGERDTGGLPPLRQMKVLRMLGFHTISRGDGRPHPLTI
jgi:hypothetical protein